MEKNKYKIIIPVSPDSINQVATYGKRDGDIVGLKHKWQKLAYTILNEKINSGDLPCKFKGKIGVFFKLFFETSRQRDGDNYEAMCKGVIDALVYLKMIKDDNTEFVDDDGRRLRVEKERPRVEVIITEKIKDEDLISINYGLLSSEQQKNDNETTRKPDRKART